MAEHTPTPWAVGTGSLGCRTHDHHGYVICPAGEERADELCVAFGIDKLDDAQFIVRAVNSHAQLLEALEEVLAWAEKFQPQRDSPIADAERRIIFDPARAAIEAAKGGD